MDYDLKARTVQGRIEYSIDHAMPFGDFAPSILMAKYEETDIGNDEDVYDNYARDTLVDQRPDTNLFACEEARGGVNARSGYLELIHGGHRGSVDTPYVPERFDQFIGPEDQDPRGNNNDGAPDMKQLRRQEDARMRFVRWNADGCDNITGGTRAERKEIADQQSVWAGWKSRLKVFDRQLDGRRNGLRREYRYKSQVPKQVLIQSYGDYMKDDALTPQRRGAFICREVIRNSKAWREETLDSDLAFARYTQICKQKRTGGAISRVADGRDERHVDNDVSTTETGPKYFKAAGLLMSNIVRGKRQAMDTDIVDPATSGVVVRKTGPFVKDLNVILKSITAGPMEDGRNTMAGKTAPRVPLEHTGRAVVYNHLAPAHHALNAEILYKNVSEGGDLRKVKDLIITDVRDASVSDRAAHYKTSARGIKTGAKLATTSTDRPHGLSLTGTACGHTKTFNYKTSVLPSGDKRVRMGAVGALGESAATLIRRPNHTSIRAATGEDVDYQMRYGDNACKDRHGRGLGSKYMVRFIERDTRGDAIATAN